MIKRNSGLAFHLNHDALFGFCTDYQGRIEYIKREKPKDEIALRLKLFKLIPLKYLPKAYTQAWKTYLRMWKVWDGERETYVKAEETWSKIRKTCEQGSESWNKAKKTWDEAVLAFLEACKPYTLADIAYLRASETCDKIFITQLHKRLCPDCPWDGKTIWPKEKIFPRRESV